MFPSVSPMTQKGNSACWKHRFPISSLRGDSSTLFPESSVLAPPYLSKQPAGRNSPLLQEHWGINSAMMRWAKSRSKQRVPCAPLWSGLAYSCWVFCFFGRFGWFYSFLCYYYSFLVRFGFGFSFTCAGGPAEGGSAHPTFCWARRRPGWATLNRAPLPPWRGSPLRCQVWIANGSLRPIREPGRFSIVATGPTRSVTASHPVLLRSAEPHKEQIKAPVLSSCALWRKSLPKCIWSPASPTRTFASRSKICRFSQLEGFSIANVLFQALTGIFLSQEIGKHYSFTVCNQGEDAGYVSLKATRLQHCCGHRKWQHLLLPAGSP